jgi:hypothetical protein
MGAALSDLVAHLFAYATEDDGPLAAQRQKDIRASLVAIAQRAGIALTFGARRAARLTPERLDEILALAPKDGLIGELMEHIALLERLAAPEGPVEMTLDGRPAVVNDRADLFAAAFVANYVTTKEPNTVRMVIGDAIRQAEETLVLDIFSALREGRGLPLSLSDEEAALLLARARGDRLCGVGATPHAVREQIYARGLLEAYAGGGYEKHLTPLGVASLVAHEATRGPRQDSPYVLECLRAIHNAVVWLNNNERAPMQHREVTGALRDLYAYVAFIHDLPDTFSGVEIVPTPTGSAAPTAAPLPAEAELRAVAAAAVGWRRAVLLGCPRDCTVDEKNRRVGRAEEALLDATKALDAREAEDAAAHRAFAPKGGECSHCFRPGNPVSVRTCCEEGRNDDLMDLVTSTPIPGKPKPKPVPVVAGQNRSHHPTAIYLRDGTKVVLRNAEAVPWLEVVPQDVVSAAPAARKEAP